MFKIRMKKKDKPLLITTMVLIILSFISGVIGNNHFEMFMITVGFIIVFKCAKISYFTIFSFILWFSFLQEYFASISRMLSSGRLLWDTSVPIYHTELFVCTISFFIIELLLFSSTSVLLDEKELYKRSLNINRRIVCIFVCIANVFIILAYPSMPSLHSELSRDMGIVSSSLIVPIVALLFAVSYDHFKKSIFIKVNIIIGVIWIVLHGDRVIVLGLIIYYVLRYLNDSSLDKKKVKESLLNKRYILVGVGLFIVALLFIRIQTTRMGYEYSFSWLTFLNSILKQGTASDVVHCFNCSVDMWKKDNLLYGYTYLYYFSNLLPSANQLFNPAMILMNKYNTLGGGLFFIEPMMNGGVVLSIIHSGFFIGILGWVFSKKTRYAPFLVAPFCILIFRFAWYGSLAGLVKMLCYYTPVIYLISKKFK